MQTLKIQTEVNQDRTITIHLPDDISLGTHEFIVIYDQQETAKKTDLMKYSGIIDWQEDGLNYQQAIRAEWDDTQ
jgi:hypothetical protein